MFLKNRFIIGILSVYLWLIISGRQWVSTKYRLQNKYRLLITITNLILNLSLKIFMKIILLLLLLIYRSHKSIPLIDENMQNVDTF